MHHAVLSRDAKIVKVIAAAVLDSARRRDLAARTHALLNGVDPVTCTFVALACGVILGGVPLHALLSGCPCGCQLAAAALRERTREHEWPSILGFGRVLVPPTQTRRK